MRLLRLLALALVAVLSLRCGSPDSWSQAKELPPETVVAIVNGEMILYKDVRASDASLRLAYRLQHGKGPSENPPGLRQMKMDWEHRRLISKIKNVIRAQKTEELGIAVSDEEISERLQALLSQKSAKQLEDLRKFHEALFRTLESIRTGRLTEVQAHQKYLAEYTSYPEWQGFRDAWIHDEQVGALKNSLEQMRKGNFGFLYEPQVKGELIDERLRSQISSILADTDQKYRDYYEAVRKNDTDRLRTYRAKIPDYLESMHQKWWLQQYAAATIEIFEKSFADVKEMLLRPAQPLQD